MTHLIGQQNREVTMNADANASVVSAVLCAGPLIRRLRKVGG
jgi:hypothetical protein